MVGTDSLSYSIDSLSNAGDTVKTLGWTLTFGLFGEKSSLVIMESPSFLDILHVCFITF